MKLKIGPATVSVCNCALGEIKAIAGHTIQQQQQQQKERQKLALEPVRPKRIEARSMKSVYRVHFTARESLDAQQVEI